MHEQSSMTDLISASEVDAKVRLLMESKERKEPRLSAAGLEGGASGDGGRGYVAPSWAALPRFLSNLERRS